MDAPPDLTGRTVLITGANAGIGAATAQALAACGATLLLHARDAAKLEPVAAAAADVGAGEVRRLIADFGHLAAVRRLADEVTAGAPVDVLINNAGLIRDCLELTSDDVELTFQVNHLAPFLLTRLLLDRGRLADGARVLTVASGAHGSVRDVALDDLARPRRYRTMDVYARSKACNILFTRELAQRLPAGIAAYAMHPGVVATNFAGDGDVAGPLLWLVKALRPTMKTPAQGADTLIWLATTDSPPPSGAYVIKRREASPRAYARDPATAAALWELSERLVAPHLDPVPTPQRIEGTADERTG